MAQVLKFWNTILYGMDLLWSSYIIYRAHNDIVYLATRKSMIQVLGLLSFEMMKLIKNNVYRTFNAQCYLKGKEHLLGLPHYQLMAMVLPCTSLLLEMLSLFDMAGHSKIHHHIVHAAIHSALNMH